MRKRVSLRRHPARRLITLIALLPLAACKSFASDASPPVDPVLESGQPSGIPSEANPDLDADPFDALELAARGRFLSLDELVSAATLQYWAKHPPADLDEVLETPESVFEAVKEQVEQLAREGQELATELREAQPMRAAGHHWFAAHTARLAWAVGPLKAMMETLPSRCLEAVDAAIERSESYDGFAPLRLKGRFLGKAPWPVGDPKQALELLRRANDAYGCKLHHQFLAELLFEADEVPEARWHWQQVLLAPQPDASESQRTFLDTTARYCLQWSAQSE